MSEEQAQDGGGESQVDTGSTVSEGGQAEQSTQVAQQPQQRSDRPAGYDPIDEATASPEQVRERLTYLYSQVKTGERTQKELKKIATEQSRLIGELTQGQNVVINHLQERSIADNEANLEGQMQRAFEAGDNKAFLDAQNKLMDLRVKKTVQAMTRPQQSQQPQQAQQPYSNAAQMANDAMDSGEFTPTEYRATEAWQAETDGSGQLLRPWAYNDSPAHQQALREAQAVWANPRFTSNEQRLAEVDRRMGVQKRTVSQSVIGGNLTTGRKNNTITLSPEIAKLAIRTKFGGPKAKSDADHIEAWKRQIEQTRSQKGSR